MPDLMATNYCSLLEGQKRRAFSVVIVFNNNLEKINIQFKKTMIVNKKVMTYDEAEVYVKQDINITNDPLKKCVREMYSIGKRLFDSTFYNRLSLDSNCKYDTHLMVEIFMVLANVEVANKLVNDMPNIAIIRSHKGAKQDSILHKKDKSTDEMSKVLKVINILKMEKAMYRVYDSSDSADSSDTINRHVGLGETYYTHFTSPIRRYFDIVVHRLLSKSIFKEEKKYSTDLHKLCMELNECHKKIGSAQRDSNRLKKVYDFYDNDPVMVTYGYIVSIRDRLLNIFVPKLDIDLEAKIISDKIVHLIEYYSNDDEFIITNKQTGETLGLKLLQKINLRIVVSKKEPYIRRKLLVELLDPSPILFITPNIKN